MADMPLHDRDRDMGWAINRYLIHHILLPPQLPQADDFSSELQAELLLFVKHCLDEFREHVDPAHHSSLSSAHTLVSSLVSIHGLVSDAKEYELRKALHQLGAHGWPMALHVRAQNAGIIMSKTNKGSIRFEAFELSPTNAAVMSTKGRLRRMFPTQTVELSTDNFCQPEFEASLTTTLAKMSHQHVAGTLPTSRKAGQDHNEERDTRHPGIVTELLMGCLGGIGLVVKNETIIKNTREEVLWSNALSPWRRSPMWLLVRVALQLTFFRTCTAHSDRLYKEFMLFTSCRVALTARVCLVETDLLLVINAKLTRRLRKLGTMEYFTQSQFPNEVIGIIDKELADRWQAVQDQDRQCLDLDRLQTLKVEQDTQISLPLLDKYLQSLDGRKSQSTRQNLDSSTMMSLSFSEDRLPCLKVKESLNKAYAIAYIQSFESWVAASLDKWLSTIDFEQTSLEGSEACNLLQKLMADYHGLAHGHYFDHPEAISIMVLTLLELWIACDKIATRICPLLSGYDPEIPVDALCTLLLPMKSQMIRLKVVEDYLGRRACSAKHPIFLGIEDPACFAVKYFDGSAKHRRLLESITEEGHRAKAAKQSELAWLQREYDQLMKLHNESSCESIKRTRNFRNELGEVRLRFEDEHSPHCRKCEYSKRANKLSINVHEWPLPDEPALAKSVIFELQPPPTFTAWRHALVFLLSDVLGFENRHARSLNAANLFEVDPHLATRYANAHPGRVTLVSESKSNLNSHYRTKKIAEATAEAVCLRNGLRYQLYDVTSFCVLAGFRPTDRISLCCTYKLPAKSKALEKFIFRPAREPSGQSPNVLIATQSDCPDHLSLEMYKELGGLAFGTRLQWLNILVQIAAPVVDFRRPETALIIWQCIYQTGPSGEGSDVLRESHACVDNHSFIVRMVEVLDEALQRVKGSWESAQSVGIYATVAARLLTLRSHPADQNVLLDFLDVACKVTFEWVCTLRSKAEHTVDETERSDWIAKSVNVALICSSCFDIDQHHLVKTLQDPQRASIFAQVAIVFHDGRQVQPQTPDSLTQILTLRFERLLHRAYTELAKNFSGLDDAIHQSWSAYRPGTAWRSISSDVQYFLTTQTSSSDFGQSLSVHFDLITGELLVDGLPLDRPPAEYESHRLYRALFGQCAVEVLPSSIPGMALSTKAKYEGQAVHLGLSLSGATTDLLIQACTDDEVYHSVPARVFLNSFPPSFADQFVHWWDQKRQTLNFRPVKAPWNVPTTSTYTLTRCNNGPLWQLKDSKSSLVVGLESDTATELARVLSPLTNKSDLHIKLHSDKRKVDVGLPSLRLNFSFAVGTPLLRSKQFSGMAVDPLQSLGCLTGLRNKLLLRDITKKNRLVLVPEGPVSCLKDESCNRHLNVSITTNSISTVHRFEIDEYLGRLRDTGSLHSKLWLAYLHALTSFALPDPLTRKTGTESALSILRSAAVRSFDQLHPNDTDLLASIAGLSPQRRYYPSHQRVMQTITWSSEIGILAQHGGLHIAVKEIFDQAVKYHVFHPECDLVIPELSEINEFLTERDAIRSSSFRVDGYGAEDFTTACDEIYKARDQVESSRKGSNAFVIAKTIFHQIRTTHWRVPDQDDLWSAFCQEGIIHRNPLRSSNFQAFGASTAFASPDASTHIAYDASLLQFPSRITSSWLALHTYLRQPTPNQFDFALWISSIACSEDADLKIVQALLSLYNSGAIKDIDPPLGETFHLSAGYRANAHALRSAMGPAYSQFSSQSPETKLPRQYNEPDDAFDTRRRVTFQTNRDRAVETFVTALLSQWPCETPFQPPFGLDLVAYLTVEEAMECVKPVFKTWFDNLQIYKYLGELANELSMTSTSSIPVMTSSLHELPRSERKSASVSVQDLFEAPAPECKTTMLYSTVELSGQNAPSPDLEELIHSLRKMAHSEFEADYVSDLEDSARNTQIHDPTSKLSVNSHELMPQYLKDCKRHVDEIYHRLVSALDITLSSNFGPRVSHSFLLQQLNRHRWTKLTKEWRTCITQYGLAVTLFQRAERLGSASKSADRIRDLQNPGHTNWNPMEYPETLLLEIESGIIIREVQEDIAAQMRTPQLNHNTVLQLNMGEGKSSVIVPIVAAALANGSQLVRVLVAKPQSKQMAEMLISKLGYLIDRQIYFLPFSRALKVDQTMMEVLSSLLHQCMKKGGILLVQPEHLLSFQLLGIERYVLEDWSVGQSWSQLQQFFDLSARDIVDESDENFSVKFELIYTMGTQRPIDLSPQRWEVIHQVLDIVQNLAPSISGLIRPGTQARQNLSGSYPRLQIMHQDVGTRLSKRLAEYICTHGLEHFPINRQPQATRKIIYGYITEASLSSTNIELVEDGGSDGFWSEDTKDILLLLRGLIAGGVLAFIFGPKRWRVNYGLSTVRKPPTKLAVPFRAKDVPSPRSEFSHPDVVIALTSLCYYYGGLTDDELFTAMSHLLEADQAELEYHSWMRDAQGLADCFKYLHGVNLRDQQQCKLEVFPHLRYGKNVIDYFLSRIVFPKEMREFPFKLSASGWDVGKTKQLPTTGFSGTNDSRVLLPLDMHYLNLPSQKFTNALVLRHLLQPQNSIAFIERCDGASNDAQQLLSTVVRLEPPTQVILDVGAQILELTNVEVARTWLGLDSEDHKEAIVYFDEEDQLSVIDREDHIELLQTSPYATQLDKCLVYLDEAHTRGTDLRLPADYRAAVTIGISLTKDRLVQACMRMRKLGKGQSVVFCITDEIQIKIQQSMPCHSNNRIEIADVLRWVVSETWTDIRRSMPLWAAQGTRFARQQEIVRAATGTNGTVLSKELAEEFLEEEAQSIEQRYRPSRVTTNKAIQKYADPTGYVDRIVDHCRKFDGLDFNSSTLAEEQERELAPEIEEERQSERAAPATARAHELHEDVINFVAYGHPEKNAKGYSPAFSTLCNTTPAQSFHPTQLCGEGQLLASDDFARTVKQEKRGFFSDAYQRSVQWILSARPAAGNSTTLLIISPYEAQELLPQIRGSTCVTIHLYKPRVNSAYRTFDDLNFFTIPEHALPLQLPRTLAVQLDLFAGQLYLNCYSDYLEACTFLGIAPGDVPSSWKIAPDGFILRDGDGRVGGLSGLEISPVPFLRALFTKIRRNGEGFRKTHLGKMLDGAVLHEDDF